MVAHSQSRAAYSLTDVTPARTIWVYRNGDPFFLGRKFVINHRYVPSFESLMIQLNEGVPTPFGVRTVYTPRDGHFVKDLTDLHSGGKYVVAGREKFRKLNYFEIGAKKPQRMKRDEVIRPVVHSNIQVPSKWQSIYNKPLILNVFTNGDTLIAPVKILIPRFTLTKWDRILALINEKVLLRSGGIHRLYTLHGQLVHGPEELEDNQFYVACSKEKFQSLPYWQHPNVPKSIQRNFGDRTPEPPKPHKRKSTPREGSPCREQSSDSKVKSIYRSPQLQKPVSPKPSTEQPKREKGNKPSVYYARSKKASPERAPKELSSDDGHSVFKAVKSQQETEGAQEIQEDKDVRVDLPVDQAPAETVQEEDIYATTEYDAEKTKDDGQYEEQNNQTEEDGQYEEQNNHNNQARKNVFKRMLGFLHRPKKKGSDSESNTTIDRGSNASKEYECSDQQENSAKKQRSQPMRKVSRNVQGNSQDGMREEKKKQEPRKHRRLLVNEREFFDENDYY